MATAGDKTRGDVEKGGYGAVDLKGKLDFILGMGLSYYIDFLLLL